MFSIYSLLFAICSAIVSCTSADTTVCSHKLVINDSKTEYTTPVFALNYNKNDLAVYKHSENALVKLYLRNASLIFKEQVNDDINDGKRIETDVSGHATLGENDCGQIVLKDCKFVIERKRSNAKLSRTLLSVLISANKCFSNSTLCSDMGVIERKNMILQKETKMKAIAVENCIVDSIIKGVAQKYNQTREIIGMRDGDSHQMIINLSFGNLNQLRRIYTTYTKSHPLTFEKNTKIVAFSFGLPKADLINLIYPLSAPNKFIHLSMEINNMVFFARISIDYSQNPCRIKLRDFQMPFKGTIHRILANKTKNISKSWLQHRWSNYYHKAVADNVEATLENYIDKGNSLCEDCKSSFNLIN